VNLKFWPRSSLSRPGKDKHASSSGLLARLLRDEEGSYLLYMTVAIPVFIGFAGFASEGSLLLYNHRTLQSATDAAAYSAAVAYSNGETSSAARTTQAEAIIASYGFDVGAGNNKVSVPTPTVITNYAGTTNTAIKVTATRPQLPILSSLWLGKNPFNVGASAIAIIQGGGGAPGNCLMTLGRQQAKKGGAITNDAPAAISLGGNPTITMPGCSVYTNSTSCTGDKTDAIALQGSFSFDVGSVGAAGCVGFTGSHRIGDSPLPNACTVGGVLECTNNWTTQNEALTDPYAGVTVPNTPATPCVTPPASGDIILNPGRYCSLNATGRKITLNAGIYIVDSQVSNKDTVIVKNGTLTDNGAGVTLVFTSSDGKYPDPKNSNMLSVDANGTVSLTGAQSGPTAGFVMMGDPAMPLGTVFDTHSNPNVHVSGTVYLPDAFLNWQGNPVTGSPLCLQIVSNTIQLWGDSSLSNTGCTTLTGGQKPIGSVVTLVN
jgi:hypothetical protein